MKALVIYDSAYGNTAKVASAVADSLKTMATVELLHVGKARLDDLKGVDLLVIGSPTWGGRVTQPVSTFVDSISTANLAKLRVAVFDTRFGFSDQSAFVRFIMRVFGFAADKLAPKLVRRGATLAAEPAGFIVIGKDGPLKDGELARAAVWAKSALSASS